MFWTRAAVAVLVTTICALPVFLVGALAVHIRADFGLRVSEIGVLVGLYFGLSALTSAAAGRATEGLGAERAMRIGALVAMVALLLGAIAQGLPWLMLALVVAALANAWGQVGANLFIARFVHPGRRALAFGIKQSGIPVSTLLGGLAVPALALTIGWRWAFVLGALLAVIVAVKVPRSQESVARDKWRSASIASVPKLPLVVLAVGACLGSAAANALGAFFVDSAVASGISLGPAGLIFASGSAVGIATRVVLGWAADRRSSGRLLWVAMLLGTGAIGYGLLAGQSVGLLALATVLCFAGGWGWPGLFNFAVATRTPQAPAAATGITQTGAYTGGVLGPLAFGFAAEQVSYASAWFGAAAVALGAALAILYGRMMLVRSGAPTDAADELFG